MGFNAFCLLLNLDKYTFKNVSEFEKLFFDLDSLILR